MGLSLDFTVIRSSLAFLSDRLFFFRVVSKRFFSRVISIIFPACCSFFITTSCLFLFLRLEGEETLKYRCACRPPYGKFNVVTNDHGHIQKFYFSVLDPKHPLWANLIPKNQNPQLKLSPRLIQKCIIKWRCPCFRLEMHFLGRFVPKNQTCQFKLQFSTLTYSNMQISRMMFTFSVFDQKYSF